MAWMSQCENKNCINNKYCLRFLESKNEQTSTYAEFQYICNQENEFQYYMGDINNKVIKVDIIETNNNNNDKET